MRLKMDVDIHGRSDRTRYTITNNAIYARRTLIHLLPKDKPAGVSPKQIERSRFTSTYAGKFISITVQGPVNPNLICVFTKGNPCFFTSVCWSAPLSAQKFWASESERESAQKGSPTA